jgi:hypothetical protein
MPTKDRVEAFVAMVVSGRHDQAILDFYHPDASMRENQDPPRVGRDRLVAEERATMARFAEIGTELLEPPLIDGDRVAVRWRFTFTPAQGPTGTMEELALQRWSGDRIAEERFFYDPRQLRPPKAAD